MKMQKSIWVVGLVTALLMVNSGAVLAQETPETNDTQMSDTQYCESEAEQAGMVSQDDIHEYVSQCLEEIRVQDEADSQQQSDMKQDDMENQ